MKKKKFLTICAVLALTGSTAYASEYKSYNFEIHENVNWGDYALEAAGSRGVIPYGGDTVKIDDGVTLTMNFADGTSTSGSAGGLALSIDEMGYGFGHEDKDLVMTGGKFVAVGQGQEEGGMTAWIGGDSTGKIMITDTDLDFQNFTYGFAIKASEAHVNNDSTHLENKYGVYAYNTGKFFAESKKFSAVNGDVGLYSAGQGSISVTASDTALFQNNGWAIYTNGEGTAELKGNKLQMINNNYGVSSSGKSVTIDVDEFTFGTSMTINFPITAIYGGGNTKVNVTAGKAELNGQIMAENNAEIQFLEDPDAGNDQLIGVYSPFGDAVSAGTDSGTAKIGFKANTVINSQGDEEYHADKQGVRTIAAIRALRNSEISLDHAVGIYGDVIAGKGPATEGTESAEGDSGSAESADWKGGKITINSVSGAEFKGDVLAGNKGTIDFTLNNGSYEGRVDDYADATLKNMVFRPEEFEVDVTDGGTVNMTLNDSTWTARGQNFVTTLAFGEEGGFVDLSKDENNSVTIRNLTGDGTFNMLLNSEDHSKSDMLYIGKNEGNQTINIVGGITGGLENISKDNPLRFATVGIDTDSDVPEVNNSGIRAYTRDAGALNLEYVVAKEDFNKSDTENEKYNGSGNGQGVDKPGNDFVENELVGDRNAVNWIITGAKEAKPSDAGKTIIDMSKINYSNAVYMDRLNKRMGEARYIDGDEGLWVRMRHDRIGKSDAFRSKNTMFELGYDRKVGDREDGEHRQGVVFDYMRGTADYHNVAGEGDVRRGGIWLYDTWLGDKGHYTDYVLKFGRLSNDFEIYARSTGEKIIGDYSNFVYSASAEYGRKKDLGNDWYIEPQAQIQYAHVTDADYTTSQDTQVELDAIDSLIGRVGFRLGRDIDEKNNFYIKADILHEFLGDQDIEARDVTGVLDTTYENKGTWYDIGLGFSHAFSKGSYMFLDVEKSFGNDNEDTYQFNVGMNWKV